MKTVWMVLAVMGVLAWSASWVSACDTCGCKAKAATGEVQGAKAATDGAVKCVACPAGKTAVKCPGECKAGCCKGDATKCAACTKECCKAAAAKGEVCKVCAEKGCQAAAKTCGAAAAATETKTCGAAKGTCGATKDAAK